MSFSQHNYSSRQNSVQLFHTILVATARSIDRIYLRLRFMKPGWVLSCFMFSFLFSNERLSATWGFERNSVLRYASTEYTVIKYVAAFERRDMQRVPDSSEHGTRYRLVSVSGLSGTSRRTKIASQ